MATSKFKPCPECGGQRVQVPLSQHMTITYSDWSPRHLTALACLDCGNTTMYTNTDILRKYAEKHQQQNRL